MPLMTPIPPGLRVEDACDYCYRPFARAQGIAVIVCPNCGLDNIRAAAAHSLPFQAVESGIESNLLPGGPERAVLSSPQPKPRRRRK
jgi:hypothetical protein